MSYELMLSMTSGWFPLEQVATRTKHPSIMKWARLTVRRAWFVPSLTLSS